MYDELKQILETGLFELEKFLQMFNLTDEQQAQLTKSLESFSEFNEQLLAIHNLHDSIMSRIEDKFDSRFEKLGKTDAHIGEQTLEFRLSIIEGCLDILHSAHKGHTNYEEAEYYGMHDNIEAQRGQLDAIQKKVDRIKKLLTNAKFIITGKEALEL